MSRADTATLSPAEAIGEEHEKTLRQFAIAAGVSLVAHALVLLLFVEPSYEEARLAGGGASFGLSGGGLGEGADTAPPSETDALEEKAEEAATEMSEAMEAEAQDPSQTRTAETSPQTTPVAAEAVTPQPATQRATPPPSASQPRPTAQRPRASAPSQTPPNPTRRSAGSTGRTSPSAAKANTGNTPSNAASTNAAASGGTSNSGTGTGSGSAQTGAGNAATSNYTGIVTAHIRRKRRSNAAGAGSAILKLSIAANGRLETIDVYKSSGSTRFDRQAMRMAKMASPYPKPPAGQGPVLVRIKGS
ncbi:MAG: TonB family protein [Pseudomonadota bacterium]